MCHWRDYGGHDFPCFAMKQPAAGLAGRRSSTVIRRAEVGHRHVRSLKTAASPVGGDDVDPVGWEPGHCGPAGRSQEKECYRQRTETHRAAESRTKIYLAYSFFKITCIFREYGFQIEEFFSSYPYSYRCLARNLSYRKAKIKIKIVRPK